MKRLEPDKKQLTSSTNHHYQLQNAYCSSHQQEYCFHLEHEIITSDVASTMDGAR